MIIKYISKKSYFLNLIKVNNFLSYQIIIFKIIMNIWGLGIGDWGVGIGDGDWAQSPIPNPQSPIPNPQFKFFGYIHNNFKNYNLIR